VGADQRLLDFEAILPMVRRLMHGITVVQWIGLVNPAWCGWPGPSRA
jgi:hypothetical protein